MINDEYILFEYSQGNIQNASKALVHRYKRFVYSVALRYLKNKEDAEDIVQDVFLKAHKSINSFRMQSSLQTWLYRITVNLCLTSAKKRKRISQIILEENEHSPEVKTDVPNPEEIIESKEFLDYFHECMSKLPEKQRETFVLRHIEELSYEEISVMLGTSIGGLKANYFQAVQKLAQIINPEKLRKKS